MFLPIITDHETFLTLKKLFRLSQMTDLEHYPEPDQIRSNPLTTYLTSRSVPWLIC